MNKTAINRKVIFLFVVVCVLLCIAIMFVHVLNKTEYKRTDDELRHEAVGLVKSDTIFELTEQESNEIFKTLQIVIPKNETDITVKLFSKIDTKNVGSYYIELDGIKDRDYFLAANINSPDDLCAGAFWNRTDDNGEYTHYFVFRVYYHSNITPVEENDYINAVGALYNNLLQARKD